MKQKTRGANATAALLEEKAELQKRLEEAEETLRAIRHGEVDALVVSGAEGEQVFTLQGAETPYRFLVEEMNEGALLLGREGTILYANARFAELTGTPLEQLIGSSWERFFAPAERPRVVALLGQAQKSGVKQEFQLESGARSRPVEVSLASMKRERLEGFSVIIADLSGRKAAEQALRESNARLKEMIAELENFSYSISHDMRAPLRAMKSFAVILEEGCANCGQVENRDLLKRISAAATRLDDLIQGSLDYARVIKHDLILQPVDLARLLRSILETYPNLLPQKAEIRIAGQLPVVLGNESALTQVFSNLLGNAVKFVKPGTRPEVRIRAEARPEGRVRVWVEDNGIGIPPTSQHRIFEMFQRAHKGYEGTGIGLAVVRKVTERMGGAVGVESEEGKGSRFWVELRTSPGATEASRGTKPDSSS